MTHITARIKLYHAPGFSSLADHVALLEAGLDFDLVKVDIFTGRLEDGSDYTEINPKGYVPALVLESGEILTENAAILCWAADRAPHLAPRGELGRYRLIEMLAFLAAEIHKRFPIYLAMPEEAQPLLRKEILHRFGLLVPQLERSGYLIGDDFSVADLYLYVLSGGALKMEFPLAECFRDHVARIGARLFVREAERREGLAA